MRIELKDAINKVEQKLKLYESDKIKYRIADEIIDKEDYWVFFYNSAKFFETGDYSYALVGNAPFIVDKYEGVVYHTGTGNPIEYYMDLFEKNELPKIKSRIE